MANTFNEYTATTGQSEFEYTFPTLNLDHVIVSVDGADSDQNTADNPPTAYEFTIIETPTKKVRLTTAPGSGKLVRVYRNTQGLNNTSADPLVDFTDGSILTESDLDTAVRQALYIAQEQSDIQFDTAGAAAGSLLAYNASTSKWEVIPINLQYDSTNETFGFGGTPATDYAHKFYGDLLVREDGSSSNSNGAVLTIENTSSSNSNAVLVLASQSPLLQFFDTNGSTDKKYLNVKYEDGTLTFQPTLDTGFDKATVPLKLLEDGTTIIGTGSAEAGYAHTIHGDVIIKETDAGQEALLTLDSSGSDVEDLASLSLYGTSAAVVFQDTNGTTGKQRQHIGLDHGSLNFAIYSDDGLTLHGIPLKIAPGANPATQRNVIMEDLPTTDPSVTGALWNRDGHVAISGQLPAIYDSGWVTSINGTALAANTTMSIVIDEDFFNNLVFRNVQVFARDSSNANSLFIPIPTSYIVEETSGGTQFSVGVKWSAQVVGGVYYISVTTGDYATLESDAPTIYNWVTNLDEIRVTIT